MMATARFFNVINGNMTNGTDRPGAGTHIDDGDDVNRVVLRDVSFLCRNGKTPVN